MTDADRTALRAWAEEFSKVGMVQASQVAELLYSEAILVIAAANDRHAIQKLLDRLREVKSENERLRKLLADSGIDPGVDMTHILNKAFAGGTP